MTKVKAIETKAFGCRFRSRLEARWAVFLNALDLEWEYEPEGFETPAGNYLPDFWIPTWNTYLEIKPRHPTPSELEKMQFVADSQRAFGAFGGTFKGDICSYSLWPRVAGIRLYALPHGSVINNREKPLPLIPFKQIEKNTKPNQCPVCKSEMKYSTTARLRLVQMSKDDEEAVYYGTELKHFAPHDGCGHEWSTIVDPDGRGYLQIPFDGNYAPFEIIRLAVGYKAAFEKALSARFEHGESPR